MGENGFVPPKEPGLLESPERRGSVAFGEAVDRDRAGAESAGDAVRAADILSINRSRESVISVIGHGDGLFFGADGEYRQDGSKDLFAGDAHRGLCLLYTS